MRKGQLFVAVRCEELPASFIGPAERSLASRVSALLKGIEHGNVRTWSTPRRLAVAVEDVQESSPRKTVVVTGPPAAAAFRDGQPTKAAIGFARSKGVDVEKLEIIESKRGPVVSVVMETGGDLAIDKIQAGLSEAIAKIAFPKSMRWGSGTLRWARPLHGVIALYDGQPIEVEVMGIQTRPETMGHRRKAQPFGVSDASSWERLLRAHWVEPDSTIRRTEIRRQLEAKAEELEAEVEDWDLLDEVVHLVEWPVTIVGQFPEDLLELPSRLLVESMKVHQRVFPLYREGKLLSAFAAVTNQPLAQDPEVAANIAEGNKRVLTARFYDAKFFYAEDRKKTLEEHGQKLDGMQWVRKGGTMKDKSQRVARLAGEWASIFSADPVRAQRAGELCKCDLSTQMVYEFPELQGHVGRLLGEFDGLEPQISAAIEEHYLPRFAGDALPTVPEGQALACADRWDSLTGCFALGLQPKGSGDPLGLRRAANGFLQVLIHAGVRLSLRDLCRDQKNGDALLEFITARLRSQFQDSHATDIVNAVLATGDTDPVALHARAEAMTSLSSTEGYEALRATFKRVMGLSKEHRSPEYVHSLLAEREEKELADALEAVQSRAAAFASERRYSSALTELGSLKTKVDAFFDAVLVMSDDSAVRNNRLGLLRSLADSFREIADFTLLSTDG
jgi:glycyl-tRNA synthetase beta chain